MAFIPQEFGLVIIESLPANEKKTGQLLYDATIMYKTFEEPNLSRALHLVNTKSEFLKVLEDLYLRVSSDFFYPILHIEAHGFEGGLQVASGEIILWAEMMSILRKINVHIENTLIIILAACRAAHLGFKPDTSDRAPFRAIVSTLRDISPNNLLLGFEAFYNTFFFSLDAGAAVDAMNLAVQIPHTFGVMTSERFFDEMLNPDRNPVHFYQTVNEKAIELKAMHSEFDNISFAVVRVRIDHELRRIFEKERKNRDYYTMKDLREKANLRPIS